jgi:hypothetical protein
MIAAGALLGSLLTALPAVDDSPAYASEPTTLEGAVTHFRYNSDTNRWMFGYWAQLDNHATYCPGFYNCALRLQFLSDSGTVVASTELDWNATDREYGPSETFVSNTAGGTPPAVTSARLVLFYT